MGLYLATLEWSRQPADDFPRGRYSRAHRIRFDGGIDILASASPGVVGKWADPAGVDPEEMFVAALSSCHMLTFLDKARRAGFMALRYVDTAEGLLAEISPGRRGMTEVVLRPVIDWEGTPPTASEVAELHHAAHEDCFIANSVTTKVTVAAS